jgi:hypothetical protein
VKGTEFIVDARNDAMTQLYLKEGTIEVAPRNVPDRKFMLTAGNSVAVTANKADAPRLMTPAEQGLFKGSETASGGVSYVWYLVIGVIAVIGGYAFARRK